jgi:hypothetical protein
VTVNWVPCLIGFCERAELVEATLHVIGEPDGRWSWETFQSWGVRGSGIENDKATAQRRAVEHAGRLRLVPAEG